MSSTIPDSIFKAYDIRGIYPAELNEDAAYRIAQAYAKFTGAKQVALGRDVRLSGPSLWDAAARGLADHGTDVIDIGVVTTDMMYFASAAYDYDGGITISASHNPREYNGMKLMRRGAVAISGDTGIREIGAMARSGYSYKADTPGTVTARDATADYLAKCASFIDMRAVKPLRVVANAMCGPVLTIVQKLNLPVKFTMLNEAPDGAFPKGPPDPLLEENRKETVDAIRESGADLGAAWDGDADRFFVFDETGRWVPGYFLTAFLGAHFARRAPGAKIIHDPRLTWATREAVEGAGGVAIVNKAGHAFIKERMRKENAVFAGEMSGHFYFRDFYYADNGLIPFLLMLEIVSQSGKRASGLFEPYFSRYFISGELNTKLSLRDEVPATLARIEARYADAKIEHIDGLSVEYADWRANVRPSNTEPLLRLNVEARSEALMRTKAGELQELIAEQQ